jgi:hypothetical protein
MSKRRHEQITSDSTDSSTAEAEGSTIAASAAATGLSTASSSSGTASAVAPLPEQALGRKRARHSPRTFSWMSILALVEVQLVLRCLDARSRFIAARCNKQLYAAASHPFAWPHEQLATFRVDNYPDQLEAFGASVRGSLLRLSIIHLRVRVPDGMAVSLCTEIFTMPKVQSLKVERLHGLHWLPADILRPMLSHPAARQLRSLDVSTLWSYVLSLAELQRLQTFSHLHSLSFGCFPHELSLLTAVLEELTRCPSLTHLSFIPPHDEQERVFASLARCTRLTSLRLSSAAIGTPLINQLAQLPHLACLTLQCGRVAAQTTDAWTALRSLREIFLDRALDAHRLLPALSSVPILRLLRWRFHPPPPPWLLGVEFDVPTLNSLRSLTDAAPLLQVEMMMPLTVEEWPNSLILGGRHHGLESYHRHVRQMMLQLPSQLPRARIVAIEQGEDE